MNPQGNGQPRTYTLTQLGTVKQALAAEYVRAADDWLAFAKRVTLE